MIVLQQVSLCFVSSKNFTSSWSSWLIKFQVAGNTVLAPSKPGSFLFLGSSTATDLLSTDGSCNMKIAKRRVAAQSTTSTVRHRKLH